MKRFIMFALLTAVLYSCGNNHTTGSGDSRINVESVDAFFAFADKITAGGEITERDWEELFSTPGYAILAHHFGEKLMKESILLGLSPERRIERDEFINSSLNEEEFMDRNVVIPWFMAHNFAEMEERWEELKEFRRTFDFDGLEAEATDILKSYLINPVDSLIEFPDITYVCMDKNARSLDKGIVMDLNLASENSYEMTAKEMAHEMFHTYRSNLLDRDFVFSNDLVWALGVVQNEGMADQIDKEPYVMPENLNDLDEGYRLFHEAYANTESILARLDEATIAFLDGEMSDEEFDEFTDNIFIFDGHPNGFYMSSMIRRQGLLNEMVEQPANPVAFARAYNKAAEKEGAFMFSARVMEYLESVEREYFGTESAI